MKCYGSDEARFQDTSLILEYKNLLQSPVISAGVDRIFLTLTMQCQMDLATTMNGAVELYVLRIC